MSRKISLNLEVNKRLSRASNYTLVSDRSVETIHSTNSGKPSIKTQESRLRETIIKTRENLRKRLQLRHKSINSNPIK